MGRDVGARLDRQQRECLAHVEMIRNDPDEAIAAIIHNIDAFERAEALSEEEKAPDREEFPFGEVTGCHCCAPAGECTSSYSYLNSRRK